MKMRTALFALADIYERLRRAESAMDIEADPSITEVTIMDEVGRPIITTEEDPTE